MASSVGSTTSRSWRARTRRAAPSRNCGDGLFSQPGLRWVLCGTRDSVRGPASSPHLHGRLSEPIVVLPVDPELAPEVVLRRLECFARPGAYVPVDAQGFARIYAVLGRHLRASLKYSEEFAMFLADESPGVGHDLNVILRRRGTPISLSFGSLRMATRYVRFSPKAAKFFGALAPGALTFVAEPSSRALAGFARSRLNAPGTIGVRLTESIVETQLSNELDGPLATTPVRSDAGREVCVAEEALALIQPRLRDGSQPRRVAVVEGSVRRPGGISTVVQEAEEHGLPILRVLREGDIPLARIEEVARRCQYSRVVS